MSENITMQDVQATLIVVFVLGVISVCICAVINYGWRRRNKRLEKRPE